MASSSRQSLRPSNQNSQQQNRQLKPLQSSNNKSLPAILSRKRKLENIQMDQGHLNSSGIPLSVLESLQQRAQLQKSNAVYHQQVISGANINVFTLKPTNCVNTSSTSVSPAVYSVRGNSVENLPPPENNSVGQSASASRANVGCGQAVSFSRAVSQGAYIIPNPSTLSIGSSVSSRVPLAPLQQSNRSYNMPQNKRTYENNCSGLNSKKVEDSYMEQDENNEAKNTNIFQLYSNISEQGKPSTSIAALPCAQQSSTEIKPPAAKRLKLRESWSRFREFVNQNGNKKSRCKTPFPSLRWADKQEMWDLMCKKENGMYKRATGDEILARHSTLQPRMRAILFDWLVEVCEVYRLHRETFYLAVDFIDRYLGATSEMPKTRLQLVGVTCLFVAAKIEEIYPPKLQEFAFVTDGACSEDEIVQMELVVLKGLNWGLSPMSPNRWMKTYMQINNFESSSNSGDLSDSEYDASDDFVIPQYTDKEFILAMQLLDLVILDLGSLSYKYSVLTASILYHCQDEQAALSASGYQWEDIRACVEWMAPFAFAMRGSNISASRGKIFTGVSKDDQHNIQSHSVELSVLETAQQRQSYIAEEAERSRDSPDPQIVQDYPMGYLEMTPPEENSSQMSISNSSKNIRIGEDSYYYETGTVTQYGVLEEKRRDSKNTMVESPSNTTNISFKGVQKPHQQSSVFLSPTSDDSGLW